MKTGLVWNELYAWHDTGNYAGVLQPDPAAFIEPDEHHENPRTKRRFKNLLDASGFIKELTLIDATHASDEAILRIHDADYICLLYTSPSPRDKRQSRMPSSA